MQLTLFAPETGSRHASLSGKTCRAYSAPKTTPSDVFWADWPEKICRSSRQGRDGRTQVMCLGHKRRIAWRILDAQYFGVAQRRRRVFVVASAGSEDPAEILFERQGEAGDFGAGAETREDPATFIEGSFGTYRKSDIGGTVKRRGGALSGGSETLIVVHGRQDPVSSMTAYALDRQGAGNTNVILPSAGKVRRLTPLECERLQGFPDNYTRIAWRNKPSEQCPDTPRYMAIGNSMAVPVIRWIGERICRI